MVRGDLKNLPKMKSVDGPDRFHITTIGTVFFTSVWLMVLFSNPFNETFARVDPEFE